MMATPPSMLQHALLCFARPPRSHNSAQRTFSSHPVVMFGNVVDTTELRNRFIQAFRIAWSIGYAANSDIDV